MKGVLLVNMGGADSPEELKTFLRYMFRDPFIIPYGKFFRNILSFIISRSRYKKSWKKYELIGGSPVISASLQTGTTLQKKLGDSYLVITAFSYSKPFFSESVNRLVHEGATEITIIPLYPQASFTTTASVENEVFKAALEHKNIKINFIPEFYREEGFVNFWVNLIKEHIQKNALKNPCLVFSAHSIPLRITDRGDGYPEAIETSARIIAEKTGHHYNVAFQSGMRKGKWIGPDTKDKIKELSEEGIDEIVIIPISFVCENLETLYDIDMDIIPYALNLPGIKKITRVELPFADERFADFLGELVYEYNKTN